MNSNDEETITPITKPVLEELLDNIRAYRQSISQNVVTGAGAERERRAAIFSSPTSTPDADFNLAAKKRSPLTAFFASLILLDEKPEYLEQRHLDSMRAEELVERSHAFYDLRHNLGGAHIVDALESNNLVYRRPYHQLDEAFDKLAVTPLDDVKQMIQEIKGTGAGASSSVGQPTDTEETPNADVEFSPGRGRYSTPAYVSSIFDDKTTANTQGDNQNRTLSRWDADVFRQLEIHREMALIAGLRKEQSEDELERKRLLRQRKDPERDLEQDKERGGMER